MPSVAYNPPADLVVSGFITAIIAVSSVIAAARTYRRKESMPWQVSFLWLAAMATSFSATALAQWSFMAAGGVRAEHGLRVIIVFLWCFAAATIGALVLDAIFPWVFDRYIKPHLSKRTINFVARWLPVL